ITGKDRRSGLFYVKLRQGLTTKQALILLKGADNAGHEALHNDVEFAVPSTATDIDPMDLQSVSDHTEYLHASGAYSGKEQGDIYDALRFYLSDRVGYDGK